MKLADDKEIGYLFNFPEPVPWIIDYKGAVKDAAELVEISSEALGAIADQMTNYDVISYLLEVIAVSESILSKIVKLQGTEAYECINDAKCDVITRFERLGRYGKQD